MTTAAIRVLGVDPGTLITGWGVIERAGTRLRGVDAGVIRPPRKAELASRLKTIHDGLLALLREHQPDLVAVEDVFFGRYARAALQLGHVRGVVLLACETAAIRTHALAPALVKRSIAGSGQAQKAQVARVVTALLGWRELPAADATDAPQVITCAQASALILRK